MKTGTKMVKNYMNDGPDIGILNINTNELIIYLYIYLFGEVFNRGYNINQHINDIFLKRSNKDVTKKTYKYSLKQREYLLINEIKNKDIEEQVASIINNININDIFPNISEDEESEIEKAKEEEFNKTIDKIKTICENVVGMIEKMKSKYKKQYDTELEQRQTLDEKYKDDEEELEKLEENLARKYKFSYMYDYNNTEAQTVSLLIIFSLMRNKIKNVSFLGELYDFNNIDIDSLYNIVSTDEENER